MGNTGIYYNCRPGLIAFASDPEALFALNGVERRINEQKIAAYLSFFPLTTKADTFWAHIYALVSGTLLSVTPEGRTTRRYWDIGQVPLLAGLKDEEYVTLFLERYRAAVKVRLRSRKRIGTTLSAGLDSGSVTALAAQELAYSGMSLDAFTSVPLYPVERGMADEFPLASIVAAKYENIEHFPIDAAAVTPLAGIRNAIEFLGAPQQTFGNTFWLMALHDAARARGAGVLLTGQMGNGGVSWNGGSHHIFCHFAAGRWRAGMKAMAEWQCPPWPLLAAHRCGTIGQAAGRPLPGADNGGDPDV